GPCPGQGYTCNDCPGGWFCPPIQTPAGPAPCGNGWPCYHCSGGWFCAPSPTLAPTTVTICTESPTSTGTAAPARQTPSDGTNPGQQSSSPPEAETTVTSTAFVTVPDASSPSPTYHPAVAGSSYAGCYKDDKSRALKNASITVSVPEGMTNQLCILFCKARGFNLAATEYGFECYCGNVLVDSYLIDDADCNKPCPGDPNCKCGGDWAMSLWTVDGEVPKGFSPKEQFVIPSPAPGQTEIEVNSGGLRQTILVVTTPVYEWPGEAPATASPAATEIDIAGFASSVQAIVSSAMQEAHQIAAAEVSRASSMISGARVGMG
ncbi:WSC domain-containing protein, partial [Cladorrhinum sp. PSN332]